MVDKYEDMNQWCSRKGKEIMGVGLWKAIRR